MINRTNKNKKKNLESLELYRQSASIGSKILEIDISFFFPSAGNCFALAGGPIGARTLEGCRSIRVKRKQNKGIEKGKKGRKGKAATKERQES